MAANSARRGGILRPVNLLAALARVSSFTLLSRITGLIREFLGAGTLFAQASNLLGPSFAFLEMKLPGYGGALLMILPPGGFAVLGFLLAGKRVMENRLAARAAEDDGGAQAVAV